MDYCLNREISYFSTLACCTLSLIGSSIVIFIFLKLRKYQTYSLRLLFYVSVSEVFKSIGFSIPCYYLGNDIYIRIVAFFARTGTICSILWAVAIANALVKIVLNNTQKFDHHHKFWMIFSFVLVIFNFGISFIDAYSNVGSLCTFNTSIKGDYLRLATIFVPDWILLTYNIFAYYKVYRKTQAISITQGKSGAVKRLFAFSILIFLCSLPISIVRVLQIFYSESCNDSYANIIAFNIYSLSGFLNAVAYLWAFKLFSSLLHRESFFARAASTNSSGSESINLLYESFSY